MIVASAVAYMNANIDMDIIVGLPFVLRILYECLDDCVCIAALPILWFI